MVVLVGFSERLADGRIANSVLILDGDRPLGVYRKTMLTGGDFRQMGFCTDFELPVWQARGLTFGCIVCANSSFVETAATMAYKGASLLFSPHYNRIPAAGMDTHRVRVRNNHAGLAALLELYVVRANVIVLDDPRAWATGTAPSSTRTGARWRRPGCSARRCSRPTPRSRRRAPAATAGCGGACRRPCASSCGGDARPPGGRVVGAAGADQSRPGHGRRSSGLRHLTP